MTILLLQFWYSSSPQYGNYFLCAWIEHKDSMGTGSVIVPGDIWAQDVVLLIVNLTTLRKKLLANLGCSKRSEHHTGLLHISEEDKRGKLHLMISPAKKLCRSNKTLIFILVFLRNSRVCNSRRTLCLPTCGRIDVNGKTFNTGDAARIEASYHLLMVIMLKFWFLIRRSSNHAIINKTPA